MGVVTVANKIATQTSLTPWSPGMASSSDDKTWDETMQKQCLHFLELLKRSSAGYVYLFTAPMCMLASNISMVEWCSFSRIDEMDGGLYYSRLDSRFIFHVTRWAFLIGDILHCIDPEGFRIYFTLKLAP